jgi:hypothetical protein
MELTRDGLEYGEHGPVHGSTAPVQRHHVGAKR